MTKRPEKKEPEPKHPAAMSGDEIMDRIVGKEAREELKKLARDHQPKDPKTD